MTQKEQFDKTRFVFEFLGFEYISSVDERHQKPFKYNVEDKVGYYVHKFILNLQHNTVPYKVHIKPFDTNFVIHKNKYQFGNNWKDLMELIVHICEKFDRQLYELFVGTNGYTVEDVFNNVFKEIEQIKNEYNAQIIAK